MNTYDKLALSDRPQLYVSAPEITDKSGTAAYPLDNNNLSPIGQPIILGNEFSFLMNDSNTLDVIGNPIFFNQSSTFECVIYVAHPEEEVAILTDDSNQNSLLITPEGITLKLFFDNAGSTYASTATVDIKNWDSKLYITLNMTEAQATLVVNGIAASISYTDSIVTSSDIKIGGGYDGYQWLMD